MLTSPLKPVSSGILNLWIECHWVSEATNSFNFVFHGSASICFIRAIPYIDHWPTVMLERKCHSELFFEISGCLRFTTQTNSRLGESVGGNSTLCCWGLNHEMLTLTRQAKKATCNQASMVDSSSFFSLLNNYKCLAYIFHVFSIYLQCRSCKNKKGCMTRCVQTVGLHTFTQTKHACEVRWKL